MNRRLVSTCRRSLMAAARAAVARAEIAPFASETILLTAGARPGDFASPALGDLDGDGRLDLVTGSLDGTFSVFYVPEAGAGWMLGAGLLAMNGLERVRRRRSRRGMGCQPDRPESAARVRG